MFSKGANTVLFFRENIVLGIVYLLTIIGKHSSLLMWLLCLVLWFFVPEPLLIDSKQVQLFTGPQLHVCYYSQVMWSVVFRKRLKPIIRWCGLSISSVAGQLTAVTWVQCFRRWPKSKHTTHTNNQSNVDLRFQTSVLPNSMLVGIQKKANVSESTHTSCPNNCLQLLSSRMASK